MDNLGWREVDIKCYSDKVKRVKYISDTHLWGVDGSQPIPIKWVLMIDPEGDLDPLPLMCTDFSMAAERIIELYVLRWNLEVTFREVREHLGVETQRQWSDKAIAKTTPVLMGLYTVVCLIANRIHESHALEIEQTAWHEKKNATFSDLIRSVRMMIWRDNLICRKPFFECFRNNSIGEKRESGPLPPEQSQSDSLFSEKYWFRVILEQLAA